jgi:proline iminopeptidase
VPADAGSSTKQDQEITMRLTKWAPLAFLALVACDTMSPSEPGNLVPKTVAEDPLLPAIELNGTRFHLETFGNPANPVIVFLHGGPGADYRNLLRMAGRYNGYSLADEYFLVFWDQRGAGLSERSERHLLTIDQYTSDLNALADRFSPNRKIVLIGESWGGMYATQYINEYPQRVAGAVLIEPGPLDGATLERLKDEMFDLDLRSEWLNDYAWHSQFFTPDDHARMDYQMMLGSEDAQPRFHQSKTDKSPSWRMGAAVNRYLTEDGQDANGVADYDFTSNLSSFTTPVLFVAGGLSEVLGESLQTEQMHQYPSASLKVVAGAGHDVAWVKAGDVVAHTHSYLDALKGAN